MKELDKSSCLLVIGGQEKWNNLHEDEQRERIARMTEKAVIELGKDAYEMLSDANKRPLKLFIWAGCGCHKDLSTVKAGYAEMSTWWEENDVTPPPHAPPLYLRISPGR